MTPQEVVVFGANGLPSIVPSSRTPAAPAPVPVPTPAPTPAPVPVNQQINLSGRNQVQSYGDNNYTVTGSQGSASLSFGNGNNDVTAQGWNNTSLTGNGQNTIVAG